MQENKFYYSVWFIIVMLIIFFPIGLYLLWKTNKLQTKTKKITTGVVVTIIIIGIMMPGDPSAMSSYEVLKAQTTYMTEDQPGEEAVYEDAKSYETEMSGEYVIGTAPSDLVSGNEKEFTTAKSGQYIAGEDFPAGVYDIEVVSGNGNVIGSGINEIMGDASGYGSLDDMYISKYDNKTFEEGDNLEVSGVSIKLIPQTEDDLVIIPGTYDLVAIEGGGNVTGSGINEIMGTADKNDLIDMYVPKYENKVFNSGDKLKVSGVSIELQPKEEKVLVKEATEPTPGKEVTELIESSPKGETCYIDNEEKSCEELAKYDELKSNLELEDTVEEKVEKTDGEYICYVDNIKEECNELTDYDNLVSELEEA